MTYTYEIYDSEYGKGYRIYVDGKLFIEQPFKPGVDGFVGMSEEEATQLAEELVNYYNNPPTTITTNKLLTQEQVNYLKQVDSNVTINIRITDTVETVIQFSRKLTDNEINEINNTI